MKQHVPLQLVTLLCLFSLVQALICQPNEQRGHPVLCRLLEWAETDLNDFASHATAWAYQQELLVDWPAAASTIDRRMLSSDDTPATLLPVVLAHGMGDSCFNNGMQRITAHIAQLLGVYAVCIPTGPTQAEDTKNGYFLNMDASVEVFAEGVRKDPQLRNGFNAVGFSQGNNIIRGYIAKHNAPTVNAFISVNGVNAGIGAVPYCRPTLRTGGTFCDLLMEEASNRAYTKFAQEHSFQANYWRDPRPEAKARYQQYSQLAKWNNEAGFVNETLRENWQKTNKFCWVLATQDGMVWPKEGEHWGAPDPSDPFHHILPMNETEWYQQDLFGLKTAQEAGKNYFESFEGDHLAFTQEDLERWLLTYFK